jgi:hypothetical protein
MPYGALPTLGSDPPPKEYGGGLPILDGEAGFLLKLPRTPVPVKQTIPMPKMKPKRVFEAIQTTLAPFGYQALKHEAKEIKDNVESEARLKYSNLSDALINEATNRYLSKF